MSDFFPITDPTWIFFTVLSIILFAPMLFERLRIPSIVGLIFAGVAVGQHGFEVLDRDASFELFGKVGIYYIMFLASLEMNMQELDRTRHKAVVFGLFSFIFPMILGVTVNHGILQYDVMPALLIAAMYASHTLLSYPIVMRFGLSKRTSVNMAVGGTLVADTLTLIVLAVVSETFKEPITGMFWLMLVVKLGLVSAVLIVLFPRIARFFFKRNNDGVVQYIFVLALVFLGAGLMELIGMEGILGAFMVGIVLNRQIPATSPLMSHIEFVGNAIFIPYFLIGVGMLINIRAFADADALILAAVMVLVASTGKWLAAYCAQRLYKMPSHDRELMFGLTNARAAATLAIVLVGYNLILPDGTRLLGEEVLNAAMILILATCILSSLTTARVAEKVATNPDEELTAPHSDTTTHDRFVIAMNNLDTIEPLLSVAVTMRSPKSNAPLSAVHIVKDQQEEGRIRGEKILEKAMKVAASVQVKLHTHNRWSVNVVSGLTHSMKELAASTLIVGIHQRQKLLDDFLGKLGNDLITTVDKQIVFYRAIVPLATMQRINVCLPPKAELEPHFAVWANQLALAAAQISASLNFFGSEKSCEAVTAYYKRQHPTLPVFTQHFDDWHNLGRLNGKINREDLIVFILARPHTLSHLPYMQRVGIELEKSFSSHNLMLLYPAQEQGNATKSSVLNQK